MEWSEKYSTGVERIDEHHRMLFKMAADYRVALDKGHGERVYAVLPQSGPGRRRPMSGRRSAGATSSS